MGQEGIGWPGTLYLVSSRDDHLSIHKGTIAAGFRALRGACPRSVPESAPARVIIGGRAFELGAVYQSVEESRLQPGGSGSKLTTSIATSVPVVTTRMTSAAPSADARTSRCADARARNSRGVPAPTSRRMTSPRL